MPYYETDMPVISTGGNNGSNGSWGDGWWGIILIALLFGWGRGGYGGFGGGNGGGSEVLGYELGKIATTNDVASGFSTSTILSTGRETQLSLQQGFANVQQTLCQGFNGINTGLLTVGNNISREISDCCCSTQRLLERGFCDVINTSNMNTQKVIDYMQNEKICSLQAENVALKGRISNDAQTAAIVGALAPKTPIPAYPVFPTTSFAYPSGVSFGVGYNNNGCCNTGCYSVQ